MGKVFIARTILLLHLELRVVNSKETYFSVFRQLYPLSSKISRWIFSHLQEKERYQI